MLLAWRVLLLRDGGDVAAESAGMTLALQLVVFGAVLFVQQDVADLGVELGLEGASSFTYRLCDVDGNGQTDLVLPQRVFFQNKRSFSLTTSSPCPGSAGALDCDLWKDAFYLRHLNRLQVVRWNGNGWITELDQALAWPDPGRPVLLPVHDQAGAGLHFQRFLHDVDSDGVPEIVVPDEKGLIIYAKGPLEYAEAARLDVFPPLQLKPVYDQRLWPQSERSVAFPAREMSCRFNFNGNQLTVISREQSTTATDGALARYRVKRFVLNPQEKFCIVDQETAEELTEPFAPHLEALRLNEDSVLDIGGGMWEYSASSTLPIPIYETRVSTDGGRSFKTMRVKGFKPRQSFVDVNSDGLVDLVTESTGLFDGGVREAISRFCTSNEIRHSIEVRLQGADGKFSDEPSVCGVVNVELDVPPLRNSLMFNRYQAGSLVCIAGNFGGDVRNDLLVQDRPDRISLYLCEGGDYAARPEAAIAAEDVQCFSAADFDGDGLDDVALHRYVVEQGAAVLKTSLYLTRQEAVQ